MAVRLLEMSGSESEIDSSVIGGYAGTLALRTPSSRLLSIESGTFEVSLSERPLPSRRHCDSRE